MRLVREGKSWSGNERTCAFLNFGHPRFANISAVTGLDFADDGRGLAVVDWDLDGDLDLWFRNRTGPRLRLMVNETHTEGRSREFVAFKLRGTASNRDAIGARVEVKLKDQARGTLIRTLYAGQGFLSQSSKWLHFGLGAEPEIEQILVRWPGGQWEEFRGVLPGRRYILVERSGQAVEWVPPRRSLKLSPSTPKRPGTSRTFRVFLSHRLELPALRYTLLEAAVERSVKTRGRPLLLNLWASWCGPCVKELKGFIDRQEELSSARLDVLALSVDGLDRQERTQRVDAHRLLERIRFPFPRGFATPELLDKLEIAQEFLLDRSFPFAVPMSFLLDGGGRLAAIYRGPVKVDELLRDVANLDESPQQLRELSVPFAGRWHSPPAAGTAYQRRWASGFRERYVEDTIQLLERALEEQAKHGVVSAQEQSVFDRERANTHFDLAAALSSQGQLNEAIVHYKQALKIEPDRADVHLEVAAALASRGRHEEAIRHYRRVLQMRPDDFKTHHDLGVALFQQRKLDEAISHYRRALQGKPRDARALNNLALALQLKGELEQAISRYRQALEVDSENAKAHIYLGMALSSTGQLEQAISHYRRALEIEPENVNAHVNLGSALLALGLSEEAVSHCRQALEIESHNVQARYNMGLALVMTGQTEAGLGHLRTAVSLQADSPTFLNSLARILATHPDAKVREPAEAVRLAERASELSQKQNPEILDTLGAAYAAVGDFDRAVTTAQAAIELASQVDQLLASQIHRRLERYRQAKPYLEPALAARATRP